MGEQVMHGSRNRGCGRLLPVALILSTLALLAGCGVRTAGAGTAAPAGRVLLEEDFSEASLWPAATDDNDSGRLEHEALLVDTGPDEVEVPLLLAKIPGANVTRLDHLSIEASVEQVRGSEGGFAVVCHTSPTHRYELSVDASGLYLVVEVGPGKAKARDFAHGFTDKLERGPNRIRGECYRDVGRGRSSFALYLNEAKLVEVDHQLDQSSFFAIGLYAYSKEPSSFRFDDVVVRALG